jgi:6-phosphogluconolactonase
MAQALKPEIFVEKDYETLSRKAAEFLLSEILAPKEKPFSVALSGGSTPKRLYEILGSEEFKHRILWERVHFFWGDERCVPPTDPESNFKMAWDVWLSKLSLPEGNIHRFKGELDPESAALAYEEELQSFFGSVLFPTFDFILLGLGPDGHTASLFPETTALYEKKRWAVSNFVPKFGKNRLTLTYPVLNSAKIVAFLVSGKEKADKVASVLNGDSSLPATGVRPHSGRLVWFLDKEAGEKISGLF